MKVLLLALLLAGASASLADGPGSRLRTGPGITQPVPPAAQRDIERCHALREEEKERCLRRVRAATQGSDRPPHAGPGPASTTLGGAAPR